MARGFFMGERMVGGLRLPDATDRDAAAVQAGPAPADAGAAARINA